MRPRTPIPKLLKSYQNANERRSITPRNAKSSAVADKPPMLCCQQLDSILAGFSDLYLPLSRLAPSVRGIPSSYRVHIWFEKTRTAGLQRPAEYRQLPPRGPGQIPSRKRFLPPDAVRWRGICYGDVVCLSVCLSVCHVDRSSFDLNQLPPLASNSADATGRLRCNEPTHHAQPGAPCQQS